MIEFYILHHKFKWNAIDRSRKLNGLKIHVEHTATTRIIISDGKDSHFDTYAMDIMSHKHIQNLTIKVEKMMR